MRHKFLAVACLACVFASSNAFAQLRSSIVVSGLTQPVAFVQDPSDPANQYVVEQGGRVRVVRNGSLLPTDFLDVTTQITSGGERGLLGLAFAPDYATSGRVFVYFTNPAGDLVVARVKRSTTTPLTADAASRVDLQWSTGQRFIAHQLAGNHNGGNIAFGPDGYLYIGTGDGGSGNDPQHNAQNPASLLGKILRINVAVPDSNAAGRAIPPDNPFAGGPAPEIWDIGLRNPWRWSFDDPAHGGTGALVIGDVGQNAWEEVDYEPAGRGGRNYGWRNREGAHDTNIQPPLQPAFQPLVDPIFEYPHPTGFSITGGFVYRGTALGSLFRGRYFFADYVARKIWSLALTVNPTTGDATASDLRDHTAELGATSVSAFGVDASGELYFTDHTGGRILRIESTSPTMTFDRASLTFGAVSNGAAFTAQTSTQRIRMTETGTGSLNWTASTNVPWLQVSPAAGTGSSFLDVSVRFTSALGPRQVANITFTLTASGATAGSFPVTLNVSPPGASAAPSGVFDSPANGTTGIAGSIAVTGWAIDDIDVTRVRIWRDPVSPEPAGALVFIGDATMVEGARPDVQAAFPAAPHSSRAGWGYLMLTNFLPGLGTGTYRLYAIAEDAEGHATTLGAKTITCANNTATAPFGAIDTPSAGATVSGTVTNFGWVLSRGPRRADPPSGGIVRVAIDGAFIGQVPSGWTNRDDLTALFPASQYPGVVDALGVAAFDTTTLGDGLHTLAWVVTDNQGSASGIGSRYFTVSNGAGLTHDPAPATQGSRLAAVEDRSIAADVTPAIVMARRGFDPSAAFQSYHAGAGGVITIQSEELGRVELQLDGVEPGSRFSGAWTGHLRASDGLAPLPPGSALSSGAFTWQHGVGFLGTYDLVFVRSGGGGPVARRDVRVVINPQRSNRVGPQVVIDVPLPPEGGSYRAQNQAILVAGWAADLDSQVDSGVDTVHVWAYPVTGRSTGSGPAPPIFIGAAAYGGARPDVAEIYGARFTNSGYWIRVQGLEPGTYDVAVFAYTTVKGGFVPARVVRVTVR